MIEAIKQINIHRQRAINWSLLGITLIFFAVLIVGIKRDLPYANDFDEPIYVERAVRMASSGNLNPEWFGNPGSTTIYPLVAIYHMWNALIHHGMFFHFDPNLQLTFNANFWEFYLLGRFLSVTYAVVTLPFLYLLGKQVFTVEVALAGTLFFVFYSTVIFYSRMVRTDSAALFFGVLSLWLLVKTHKQPTMGNQILTGLAIGFSIASRYFMVALVPILMIIDGSILLQQKSKTSMKLWGHILFGLSMVFIGFTIATPYFFFELDKVIQNILFEARNTQIGFDGLSPWGNFLWYITYAIPNTMKWPQTVFACVGMGFILWKKQFSQLLILGFVIFFFIEISVSALHWPRWIIQILPVLALFASYSLSEIVKMISKPLGYKGATQHMIFVLGVLILLSLPVYNVVMFDMKWSNYSTRISAREWLLENLPPHSHIFLEKYTAPLINTDFVVDEPSWSLPQSGYTLDELYQRGYRYVVISSNMYGRFFAEPERYRSEMELYQTLFDRAELLQEIEPSTTRGGRTIRIYRLSVPGDISE